MGSPSRIGSCSRVTVALALAVACLVIAPRARAQDAEPTVTLSGRVTDGEGRAVGGAEIIVAGLDGSVRTGEDGRFRISGIDPGARTVTARRLGFAPATTTAMLGPGERTVDLVLRPFPYRLASVRVRAPAPRSRTDPRIDAFNSRRARASGGTFITKADIEAIQARQMSDLLRLAPGFRVSRDRRGSGTRVSSRGNTGSCRMRMYLDGMAVEMIENNLDLMVRVDDVEAVELYRGVSTAPAEFSGADLRGDAACGVIVVWTRNK